MNPHSETQNRLLEIAFYEIGRHIRPRPDWHSPQISNDCWLWRGDMTTNRDAQGNLRKTTSWSNTGRTTYPVNRACYPILRIGGNTAISVHRLLFMLYRRPSFPVTKLERNRACQANCVNPFHWDARTSEERTRADRKCPQNSLLSGVLEFLEGRDAEDRATKLKRIEMDEIAIDEHMLKLQKTSAIIPLDEYKTLKAQARGKIAAPSAVSSTQSEIAPEPEIEEIHDFAKRYWLVDPVTMKERIGAEEDYNAVAHWKAVFKLSEISQELETLLRWYSVPLPIHNESASEYWIGRESLDGAAEQCYEAMKDEGRLTGTSIATMDKRTHIRLMLLTMDRHRPGLVAKIDWSK